MSLEGGQGAWWGLVNAALKEVWPGKLERAAGAVPPRTEMLGLDPVGNESQKTPGTREDHVTSEMTEHW